jgi:hypothetical protein
MRPASILDILLSWGRNRNISKKGLMLFLLMLARIFGSGSLSNTIIYYDSLILTSLVWIPVEKPRNNRLEMNFSLICFNFAHNKLVELTRINDIYRLQTNKLMKLHLDPVWIPSN